MPDFMTEGWFLLVMLLILMTLVGLGVGLVLFVVVQAGRRRDWEDDGRDRP